MILALFSFALAADSPQPVRPGDTVQSLSKGDPEVAAAIRELNRLGPDDTLTVGAMVRVPDPAVIGQQEAFLISLTGQATVTAPGEAPKPLATFVPIPKGHAFCTLEGARATVRLASSCNTDGSASDDINLMADTCVEVTAANSRANGRTTVVRVTSGSIAVLAQQDAKGEVTVVTPTGITSGEAGGFRVTLEENASRTETLDGSATVSGSGAQVALVAGQGSRVRSGEAPSPPVDLLRTEQLLLPEDPSVLLRPTFTWSPVEGALGYRLEMGGSPDFREVLYLEDVSEPVYDPLRLMLPYDQFERVFWRVSSFDRFGFLGVPSDPRTLTFPPALR